MAWSRRYFFTYMLIAVVYVLIVITTMIYYVWTSIYMDPYVGVLENITHVGLFTITHGGMNLDFASAMHSWSQNSPSTRDCE